jgi:hypothetical protein
MERMVDDIPRRTIRSRVRAAGLSVSAFLALLFCTVKRSIFFSTLAWKIALTNTPIVTQQGRHGTARPAPSIQ